MTLATFLLVWNWAMHVGWLVFVPNTVGLGNHVVAESNWHDAVAYAHTLHGGFVVEGCDYPYVSC